MLFLDRELFLGDAFAAVFLELLPGGDECLLQVGWGDRNVYRPDPVEYVGDLETRRKTVGKPLHAPHTLADARRQSILTDRSIGNERGFVVGIVPSKSTRGTIDEIYIGLATHRHDIAHGSTWRRARPIGGRALTPWDIAKQLLDHGHDLASNDIPCDRQNE